MEPHTKLRRGTGYNQNEELYILERILVTFDPLKAILPDRFNPCPFILDCDAVKKGSGRLQISYVR